MSLSLNPAMPQPMRVHLLQELQLLLGNPKILKELLRVDNHIVPVLQEAQHRLRQVARIEGCELRRCPLCRCQQPQGRR